LIVNTLVVVALGVLVFPLLFDVAELRKQVEVEVAQADEAIRSDVIQLRANMRRLTQRLEQQRDTFDSRLSEAVADATESHEQTADTLNARIDTHRTEVDELRSMLMLLNNELIRVERVDPKPAIATPTVKALPEGEPPSAGLAGQWLMTLPAGYQYETELVDMGENRYRLKGGGSVFRGLYEVRGDRLVIIQPDDERLTEFQWQIQGDDVLVLVEQPPAGKTGSNDIGAKLTRFDAR